MAKTSEAQLRASAKWTASATCNVQARLMLKRDAEVLEYLKDANKADFVRWAVEEAKRQGIPPTRFAHKR